MLSDQRLIIVEEEFLIAMDIQRIVESANARQPLLARNFKEVAALGDDLATFDLTIMTPPRDDPTDHEIAARMVEAGLAIVVCSAAMGTLAGTVLEGAETITKPFADADLLAACRRAIERRKRV